MIVAESNPIDERRAQSATQCVVGAKMPAIKPFSPNSNGEVDMAWLSSGHGAVIYLFPGWVPGQDGKRSAAADPAQTRDLEAQHLQLAQMSWRLAGVSIEEPGELLGHIYLGEVEPIVLDMEHIVLVDMQLRAAQELGLPTYYAEGRCQCYGDGASMAYHRRTPVRTASFKWHSPRSHRHGYGFTSSGARSAS